MAGEQTTEHKQTILITGASGNLGFAVTQHLVNNGYQILALDASTPRDAYVDHPMICPMALDLADPHAVQEYVSKLDMDVTAAILTVGGFTIGGFEDTSMRQIQQMIELNFETTYHIVRALLPGFKARGAGQFVLIGARPALDPSVGKDMVAYALSKQLVFGLSELINAAGAGSSVHSTVIVPSTIDTPANRKSMPDADPSDWVSPQSIAESIHFLLTDSGSQIREGIVKMYHKS
jgi:NAD(P)-dependent dehydrogenase (short-subunit alcohol dehydrogenase family)